MENVKSLEFIEKVIDKVIKLYYQETKLKPIDVKIELTDDIYKRKLELALTEEEKKEIIETKDFNKNLNGSMVIPRNIEDTAHILISLNTIYNNINNYQFISTITHELTHLHDYYDFYLLNEKECTTVRDIDKCDGFRAFQLWSEYNARRKGYYFYRYITNIDNNNSEEEQINYINNIECPFHMRNLAEELNSLVNEPYLFIYSIIQFLGRFSVWNDLFPNFCNIDSLPNELTEVFDSRILNLYEFLYNHKSFEKIKFSFNQLDELLCQFVKK